VKKYILLVFILLALQGQGSKPVYLFSYFTDKITNEIFKQLIHIK